MSDARSGLQNRKGSFCKAAFDLQKCFETKNIQSCHAEPVKMNIVAYQHCPSEGITDLILTHRAFTIIPERRAGMKSKQIVSVHIHVNQAASILGNLGEKHRAMDCNLDPKGWHWATQRGSLSPSLSSACLPLPQPRCRGHRGSFTHSLQARYPPN